jgi:hypothetical protein
VDTTIRGIEETHYIDLTKYFKGFCGRLVDKATEEVTAEAYGMDMKSVIDQLGRKTQENLAVTELRTNGEPLYRIAYEITG